MCSAQASTQPLCSRRRPHSRPATMLSHTPPKFTPGSYDPPMFNKRARAGSISGRLRSASDLCDEGIITPQEKGIIKVSCRVATTCRGTPLVLCGAVGTRVGVVGVAPGAADPPPHILCHSRVLSQLQPSHSPTPLSPPSACARRTLSSRATPSWRPRWKRTKRAIPRSFKVRWVLQFRSPLFSAMLTCWCAVFPRRLAPGWLPRQTSRIHRLASGRLGPGRAERRVTGQ